jgi:cysteine desulfurase
MIMHKQVYLDYAAGTPMDPKVYLAMQPYLTKLVANPSAAHSLGRAAGEVLEDARRRIAKVLGAKPAEIIFTSGSTEAALIAIQGVARAHPSRRLVASVIEHEAVLAQLGVAEHSGHQTGMIIVGESGVVQPAQVASAIDDMTVLVCLQYVNNEIGTLQPLAAVASEIARIRADRATRGVLTPLYLYSDAAQAGLLNLQASRLGVDLLSMGGDKLYGPVGTGFLYVRTGTELASVMVGGGQERGLRSGTPNVAGAVGLATALELVQADREAESKRQRDLCELITKTVTTKLQGVMVNGDTKQRLGGNLNLSFENVDGEELAAHLDAAGFAVATGAACRVGEENPSYVLQALGRSPQQAVASLRITVGRPVTKRDAERFTTALVRAVQRVRELGA